MTGECRGMTAGMMGQGSVIPRVAGAEHRAGTAAATRAMRGPEGEVTEGIFRANPRRYRAVAALLPCQSTPSSHHSSVEVGDPHQSTRRRTSQAVESDLPRQSATFSHHCHVSAVPVYAVVAPFQRRGSRFASTYAVIATLTSTRFNEELR